MNTQNHDDERELQDLERRLDAAFTTTRPRRGFEDDLWERVHSRQPRGGLLERLRSAALPLATTGAALVLLAGLVTWVVDHRGPSGGAASSASAPAQGSAVGGQTGLRFGAVPRPPAAAAQPGYVSAAPSRTDQQVPSSAIPPTLPVYRYPAAAGPPPGSVFGVPPAAPAGAEVAPYPTRPASQAVGEWPAAAGVPGGQATASSASVAHVQLVYVAVNEGRYGYLVPAYQVTGTMEALGSSTQVSALLPALATYALR